MVAGAVVVRSKTTDVPRPIFALAILALALASLAAVLIAPRAQARLASTLEALRYRVAIGGTDLTAHTGPFLVWPEARGATSYRYDITWRDNSAAGFYAVSVRNPSTDDARIIATAYTQAESAVRGGAPQAAYSGALWEVTAEGTGTCSYTIAGARGRDAFIVSLSGSTCGTVKARARAVEKAVLARL
jgi:hypothetical protein